MSMQISVDPAGLSQEQREAVAGFILAYPGKACSGTCGHAVAEIHAHTAGVVEGPTTAPVVPAVNDATVEKLAADLREDEKDTPVKFDDWVIKNVKYTVVTATVEQIYMLKKQGKNVKIIGPGEDNSHMIVIMS